MDVERGYSVKQTNDGGYIISGRSNTSGHGQAYLIKTDGEGNVAVQEEPSQKQIASPYLLCSPNPFCSSTTISLSIPAECAGVARLQIYDINGRLVRDFPRQAMGFGNNLKACWDGKNRYGNKVSSGIYFVVLRVNQTRFSEKLILVQ